MSDVEVLSFSGGWQSSTLLWMAIRGEIQLPLHFAAAFADTGDERSRTYEHLDRMQSACEAAGVTLLRPDGPKITDDWQPDSSCSRIDTIPYWTKKEDGSRGQLNHCCTRHYKVRVVRKAIRRWLSRRLEISLGRAFRVPVTQWIGFAADEANREDKLFPEGNWGHRCPLIELGITKQDCIDYHRRHDLPEPIPSVCAGCFGHGLRSLKWMHDNDPEAWQRAVDRDDWVRHGLKKYGVKLPVYVSDTLRPLRELAENDFKLGTMQETAQHECASGACFV